MDVEIIHEHSWDPEPSHSNCSKFRCCHLRNLKTIDNCTLIATATSAVVLRQTWGLVDDAQMRSSRPPRIALLHGRGMLFWCVPMVYLRVLAPRADICAAGTGSLTAFFGPNFSLISSDHFYCSVHLGLRCCGIRNGN